MNTRYDTDFDVWHAQFAAHSARVQDTCDRLMARFDRIDALLQSIRDHLAGKATDVPLHKRGFGVMEAGE
jgi:hypothetical protein